MKTMRYTALIRFLMATVFTLTLAESLAEDSEQGRGRTVQVAVVATDSSGGKLRYRWRSTDGSIADVNSPTTTWALPPGPGLHYAYVLVSNGLGGYTQRRVGVNTDDLPWAHDSVGDSGDAHEPPPPAPAPAQVGDYFRGFITALASVPEDGHSVYMPGVLAYLQDPISSVRYPALGGIATNSRGEYVVPGVALGAQPFGNSYDINCSFDGGVSYQNCGSGSMLDTATPDYFPRGAQVGINGAFLLLDGSPCGVEDEFFGVHSSASATLLGVNTDGAYYNLAGPVRVNEFGDFALPNATGAAAISLRCEHARATLVTSTSAGFAKGDGGLTRLTGVSTPMVTGMSATWKGKSVGTFLPPPTGFASDILTRSNGYLAGKGIDSRLGACQYYKAVGAVQGCDRSGHFTGAVLTYDAWRRAENIGPYAKPRVPQYTAAYINRADLNLARVHTSISYGPNDTAAVVCNHLGPPAKTPDQLLNPPQSDVDMAVMNAVDGKNLVACVAMDYQAYPGVNNGEPFVRFLIFGPSGALLPSVNLDGRSEKFVPGTCVVCHGGDHYQGKFPEDGSGSANIGGHFLPYDTGNFEFAQVAGLRQSDQEESIYHLNQNVLQTGPTVAEMELIAGWYKNSHVLDTDYLPESWQTPVDPNALAGSTTLRTYQDFYRHVVARACRTCHAALIEAYNFDHEYNIDETNNFSRAANAMFVDPDVEFQRSVCGGQLLHTGFERLWMMPNSLVTFNRLWGSYGSADDQVTYLNNYLALAVNIPSEGSSYACGTSPAP
jgi:hypothetical protein